MRTDRSQEAQQWRRYAEDPAWIPYRLSPADGALTFAHMPREAQRAVPFLDQRHIADAPQAGPAPLNELPLDAIREAARPMHFIFHTAFCCSTLLSRAFDAPGASMGVSEPIILTTLAKLFHMPGHADAAKQALGPTLDLLSRPLAPGETQIIKASNFSNLLAPHVLDQRPDSKIIVMHSTLDAFIASTARRGMIGRVFGREMFQHFNTSAPLNSGYTTADWLMHSDLQIAAQAWLMQTAFLDNVIKRYGPARVRTLSGDALLADKSGTLNRAAQFFGLRESPQRWEAIAQGPVFAHHGKDQNVPFDDATRQTVLRNVRRVLGSEIEPALAWAQALAAQCRAPLDLGNTLVNETP